MTLSKFILACAVAATCAGAAQAQAYYLTPSAPAIPISSGVASALGNAANSSGGIVTSPVGSASLATGAAAANLGFTPLSPTNNLSELSSPSSARTNLGLGALATVTPGAGVAGMLGNAANTAGGLVSAPVGPTNLASGAAAGNLGFTPLNPANNLSDLLSASSARTNMGLGTLATTTPGSGVASALAADANGSGGVVTSPVGSANVASGAAVANLGFTPLNPASNLSDLSSASSARTNLGLGPLATAPQVFVYGASLVADGYAYTDAAMAAGSTTLAAASRACQPSDWMLVPPREVVVAGAGVSSAPLKTYVAGCSGSSYVLASPNASGGTVSGMIWAIGSDQSAALNSLVAANPNAWIVLPAGSMLLDATTVALNKVTLSGAGIMNNVNAGITGAFNLGTQLLLVSPTTVPFTVQQSVRLTGLTVFYPGQAGVTSTPVAYPPTFEDNGTNPIQSWMVDHVSFINPYDLYAQTSDTLVTATVKWTDIQGYCVHSCIKGPLEIGETWYVTNVDFNGNNFPGTPTNLYNWTEANGSFLIDTGSGSTSGGACDTHVVGFQFTNLGVHGMYSVLNLTGAYFTEVSFVAPDIGAVEQFATTDAGTKVGISIVGGFIQTNGSPGGGHSTAPAVDLEGTCTGGGPGSLHSAGTVWVGQAGLFQINGNNTNDIAITGGEANWGLTSSLTTTADLMTLNDTNAAVSITGVSRLISSNSGSYYSGVAVTNADKVTIAGNTFQEAYYALDTSALASGSVVFGGNVVNNTQGPTSLNVPTSQTTAGTVVLGTNNLDIPGALTAPVLYPQVAVPMILPGSGSMGNNGALTITGALDKTYGNAYMYMPAGAISAGSAAGWYYAQCSTTTACTLYNNTYSSGSTTVPTSPTAFSTTGPGAYTQTTGSAIQAFAFTVAANSLGPTGGIDGKYAATYNNSSNAKVITFQFGACQLSNVSATTTHSLTWPIGLRNTGVTNAQTSDNSAGGWGTQSGGVNSCTVSTTANVTAYLSLQLAAATDYLVLQNTMFQLIPGK